MILSDYTLLVQREADDTSAQSKPIIERGIMEIYQDFLKEVGKYIVGSSNETKTIASGAVTPSSFIEILDVKYVNGTTYELVYPITKEDFLKNHLNDSGSVPQFYFVNGSSLNVSPSTATGTLRIEYVAVPTELTGDVVSVIPDRYTDVIKTGALYKYLAYDKDPAAVEYKSLYDEAKRKAVMELTTNFEIRKPTLYGV